MADPILDLVVANWHDAVHTFLESTDGQGVLKGFDPAEKPIFIALLEAHVPAEGLERDMLKRLIEWRISRERELRKTLGLNLFATSDEELDEVEVSRRFLELQALARGSVRMVQKIMMRTEDEAARDESAPASGAADMPTIRPDIYPTSPVQYDADALELMSQRESVPDGVELVRLEARISKSMEAMTAMPSGEFRAINPPPEKADPVVDRVPKSPAPSLESFGLLPDEAVDDPEAPTLEVGEAVGLDDGEGFEFAFEDALNHAPSRK